MVKISRIWLQIPDLAYFHVFSGICGKQVNIIYHQSFSFTQEILFLNLLGPTFFKRSSSSYHASDSAVCGLLQVNCGTSPSWSRGPCLTCWWRSMAGRTKTPVSSLTSFCPCWRWCLRRGPRPANASITRGSTPSHKHWAMPSSSSPLPTQQLAQTPPPPWWQPLEPRCGKKLATDEKDLLNALSHISISCLPENA